MIQTVQTFQLGKSTVVTLPKSLGIKPGIKLTIRKQKYHIVLKPVRKKEDAASIVKRLAGGIRFKYSPTPEEMNKAYDEQYEEMLR